MIFFADANSEEKWNPLNWTGDLRVAIMLDQLEFDSFSLKR